MPRREDTARRGKARAAASAPAPAPANALQEQVPGEEELAKKVITFQQLVDKLEAEASRLRAEASSGVASDAREKARVDGEVFFTCCCAFDAWVEEIYRSRAAGPQEWEQRCCARIAAAGGACIARARVCCGEESVHNEDSSGEEAARLLLEQLRTFREACGERADGLCRYCGLLAERRCDALGCGVCVHQECMLEHTCWVRDASLCTLL